MPHPPAPPPVGRPHRFKLAALSAVGIAMIALPLVEVLRHQAADLRAALSEQAALDPVSRAVAVQRALLAHRDVAGEVLRGSAALEAERRSRQGDVDARVAALAGALVVVASDRAIDESNALREDWALLARQVRQRRIDAVESDFGHRLLGEQALQVIDFVAHAAGLGGDRDPAAALLATVGTRSLPRLAAEIATLPLSGVADAAAGIGDDRQLAATEAALSRTLGRLDERIEAATAAGSPLPGELASATAEAGAAADRYFALLRGETGSRAAAAATTSARADATRAVRRLHDATLSALGAALDDRVESTRRSRDTLLAAMGVLALLAVVMLQRIVASSVPPPVAYARRGDSIAEGLSPDVGVATAIRAPSHRDVARGLLTRLRDDAAACAAGRETTAAMAGEPVERTLPPT